jgi:hypothetical protein
VHRHRGPGSIVHAHLPKARHAPALPPLDPARHAARPAAGRHAFDNGSLGRRRQASAPGRPVTQARAVGSFEAVTVNSPFDVVLRQCDREAVEVLAVDKLQALIETTVVDRRQGRTLEIGLKKGVTLFTLRKVVVTVDVVNLRALTVNGSGDVSGNGLKAARLDVSVAGAGDVRLKELQADALSLAIAGSGDIEASGRAARLAIDIAGSGDVATASLDADEVSVRIAGSGDVDVIARKTLAVSISGSGDVTYRGDPQVTRSIAGSGTLTRR